MQTDNLNQECKEYQLTICYRDKISSNKLSNEPAKHTQSLVKTDIRYNVILDKTDNHSNNKYSTIPNCRDKLTHNCRTKN